MIQARLFRARAGCKILAEWVCLTDCAWNIRIVPMQDERAFFTVFEECAHSPECLHCHIASCGGVSRTFENEIEFVRV